MERQAIVVCCVVGFLGLLSAAAGFAAEAKRIKGSQVQFLSATECVYPRSPALALGFFAAVALLIAHSIINVATGCICDQKDSHHLSSSWSVPLVCFVVSWFTFVISFFLLVIAASISDLRGEEHQYFGNYYCYVLKPGVFAGAAVLSLISVILGIFHYLTLTSGKDSNTTWVGASVAPSQGGIAMGQPRFPPQHV